MTPPRQADGSANVEVLEPEDCRARLEAETLSRVAFANGEFPMVLPVNYVFFDDLIVFRTDAGLKLENVPMCPVAFEIDGVNDSNAWSVVVLGHAREMTTALGPRYDSLRELEIAILAPGRRSHWIGIEMQSISGRTFPIARKGSRAR